MGKTAPSLPKYIPSEIEPKWQRTWEEAGLYKTPKEQSKKKYVLDMYPYPSGATMHVGHLEGYVGTDILSRYYRMKGYHVLHPMGWDSFGLPAENYAIKTGIHPEESTRKNIAIFKRQLKSAGLSYDWDREINSSDPHYYKWNQWLFILLFKRGLAYKAKAHVNWCPSCETVLANEQVVEARPPATSPTKVDKNFTVAGEVGRGKCERCETEVVQKKLDQWFFKITAYAERLLSGLDGIDWLDEVKLQQKNWIGRSEGAEIKFSIFNFQFSIPVFTTRPDTLAGATFLVLSPEHELAQGVKLPYEEGEKNGAFTGKYAINPLTGKEIPIWVADYVLSEYGTGAIMGVPAHDERDREFAEKYGLTLIDVETEGTDEEVQKAISQIESNGWGERKVSYHLRDWLISRQRYWGTPIPMIYCEKCAHSTDSGQGWQPVLESDLPVLLPKDVDFRPTGQSPITRSQSFQENVVCPSCGGEAKREVDTMDGYVDSSWYFIRFADPHNNKEFASQKAISDWLPVDTYVGGGHVVQHLLFARFFWKVLFDAELIDKSLGDEPFDKLRAPGWILGPDSRKMSKRWNNVVTPDDVIPKFGADTLRMYEMFMGPFDAMKPWSLTGVEGMWRFLNKIWRLFGETWTEEGERNREVDVLINRLIQKVGSDIEEMKFNTAISAMMETYNALVEMKRRGVNIAWGHVWKRFLLVMAPFAPHITEELWQQIRYLEVGSEKLDRDVSNSRILDIKESKIQGQEYRTSHVKNSRFESIHLQPWPSYDPTLLEEEEVTIVVQVDGRVRSTLRLRSGQASQDEAEAKASESERVRKYLEGKRIKRVVYVEGKIINFVTS